MVRQTDGWRDGMDVYAKTRVAECLRETTDRQTERLKTQQAQEQAQESKRFNDSASRQGRRRAGWVDERQSTDESGVAGKSLTNGRIGLVHQ